MEHTHDHDHAGAHGAHNERRETFTLAAKSALLIGLGLYFTYNIVSGNLTNYINERFSWLSYLAAALFLLIGGYSLYHLLVEHFPREKHKHDDAHDHADHEHHDHAHLSWGALMVVAIPLVLGTLIPSRPLGAESVDGAVSLTAAAAAEGVTTFAIDPSQRNVLDWLRVFNNAQGDFEQFNGLPVDVIGFVYTEPTFTENQFMVARFTISCCVADASAIGLPVNWAEAVEQGAWVQVKGVIEVGEFRGEPTPLVRAESVIVVEQPAHPYLYP